MASATILNAQTEAASSSVGNSAQATIVLGPYATRAVVFASAYGKSTYNSGGAVNAGILVSLMVDGQTASIDDSFEGESSSITYYASPSHNFVLAKNSQATVLAKVDPYGAGGANNQNTSIALTCIALAAE